MTCRDIDGLVISYASDADVPPEAAAHIAGCERCRRLVQAMRQTPQVTPPAAEQLRRIESRILADLKPVKPLASAGALWIALVLLASVVVAIGVAVLGTAGWHALAALQRAAVFTALAAAAGLLAFSTGGQMVPGSALRPPPRLLIVAALGAISGICATLFVPRQEATFVATGLVCLRIGVTCAIASALLLWLLLRRGAVLNPMLTGVTAGALAGLSGLTVLEIFCPNLNRYHILTWHLGAVFVSVAAGVVIGVIAEYSRPARPGP